MTSLANLPTNPGLPIAGKVCSPSPSPPAPPQNASVDSPSYHYHCTVVYFVDNKIYIVRLILNNKKIPYTTHWLEYPDIASHHTALGIPPNQPSATSLVPTPYTLPTIRIPASLITHSNENCGKDVEKDRYIMDSALIASELEKLYPDPPLYLNSEEQQRIQMIWGNIMKIIGPTLLPK
ncbi:MAG: hypothetical protein Q9172_006769, partial [Xanthocarpia lactea]